MSKTIVTAASLEAATNDPLARLVKIFGDENGHRLFGAAVGEAPAGFLSRDDYLDLKRRERRDMEDQADARSDKRRR